MFGFDWNKKKNFMKSSGQMKVKVVQIVFTTIYDTVDATLDNDDDDDDDGMHVG